MNRTQRIAVGTAVGAAFLLPVTSAAQAEPFPWHDTDGSGASTGNKAQIEHSEPVRGPIGSGSAIGKAQVEHAELLRAQQAQVGDESPVQIPVPDETGIPWEAAGLVILGVGAVAGGAVVVAGRSRRHVHA